MSRNGAENRETNPNDKTDSVDDDVHTISLVVLI
jgi:hypothetical protein